MIKQTTVSLCIYVWGKVVFNFNSFRTNVPKILKLDGIIWYNRSMKSLIQYKKNNNIVYSCKYHVVWCPKYRRNVLVDGVDNRLKSILFYWKLRRRQTLKWLKWRLCQIMFISFLNATRSLALINWFEWWKEEALVTCVKNSRG